MTTARRGSGHKAARHVAAARGARQRARGARRRDGARRGSGTARGGDGTRTRRRDGDGDGAAVVTAARRQATMATARGGWGREAAARGDGGDRERGEKEELGCYNRSVCILPMEFWRKSRNCRPSSLALYLGGCFLYQTEKQKITGAKPGLELQREHHSTGTLDSTDEAYSSENPPSDTYSHSGVGKNRARLSTTHCTQQVILE
uniref:Uncharacterized protein n=1 Tax=Oryza sativa subsp. japonica TaxID=39947 RepID=Q6K2N3_ORYSJ|nr:hypothetical protein [Oryza sativa Japonica Group]